VQADQNRGWSWYARKPNRCVLSGRRSWGTSR
jgi:hypothetical protein